MKNVVIVAHKFLQQPDDDLVTYLTNEGRTEVMHITHTFPDSPSRISSYIWIREGKQYRSGTSFNFIKYPEPIVYLKEIILTLFWIIFSQQKWEIYIGMDGFFTALGILLKYLGIIKKVAFWSMDFVPENRFRGVLGSAKNWFYHKVNVFSYLNCDEMWDISPRMSEAREKFLGIPQNAYKSHKIVPFGVWVDRIKTYSYDDCEKNTIVFMGHLLEKQGVQVVIEALSNLSKIFPAIKLKVIGTGRFKEQLIKLANSLGVSDRCVFMGEIPDHAVLEEEIAKCAVAVAPYVKELDTWTYYADPGKIKVYIACGVPVVMTDLPWIYSEIENTGSGLIVRAGDDISSKIEQLLNADNNKLFRDNARNYSSNFNYLRIFSDLTL